LLSELPRNGYVARTDFEPQPRIMSAFLGSEVFDFTTFGQTAVAAKCLKVHRREGENPANLPRSRMYCWQANQQTLRALASAVDTAVFRQAYKY